MENIRGYMKLRIDPNRIRFRLSQAELNRLTQTNCISEKLVVAEQCALSFSILIDDSLEQMELKMLASSLTLLVSKCELLLLTQGKGISKEGISRKINSGDNEMMVSLQVELACEKIC